MRWLENSYEYSGESFNEIIISYIHRTPNPARGGVELSYVNFIPVNIFINVQIKLVNGIVIV